MFPAITPYSDVQRILGREWGGEEPTPKFAWGETFTLDGITTLVHNTYFTIATNE